MKLIFFNSGQLQKNSIDCAMLFTINLVIMVVIVKSKLNLRLQVFTCNILFCFRTILLATLTFVNFLVSFLLSGMKISTYGGVDDFQFLSYLPRTLFGLMDFTLNFWSFQAYFLSYNNMFDPELNYILLGPFSAFSDNLLYL